VRDPETTHKIMSAIHSKDTRPELALRRALWRRGLRYRVAMKTLPGKPDIVFTKAKIVVFCDGDYWHGHNWALRGIPSLEEELAGYSEYWQKKIRRNMERDKKNTAKLESDGWLVLRFWESEIKKNQEKCVEEILLYYNKRKERSVVMPQIDTYRTNVIRKREEIAKLTGELAKEQAKIPPLQSKINFAKDAIGRTKIASTVKTKLGEIARAEKSIADTNKNCSEIQKKIAQKEKELSAAEKTLRQEEDRVNKKKADEEKRRARESSAQMAAMEQTIREHELTQSQMQADIELLKAIPEKITILFMASNPSDTSRLCLDEEVRGIQEKIRLSDFRDSIVFESRWAVRSSDILQAINETNPTIIHFSGHGASNGDIVLQNPDGSAKLVTKDAMATAISTMSDSVRLVVFNACFSDEQAKSVVEHIDAAIGMNDSIPDDTACVFAAQLYSSIGFGYSVDKAFRQAIAELMLEGISGESIPQLFTKDGVDPDSMVLVAPNTLS